MSNEKFNALVDLYKNSPDAFENLPQHIKDKVTQAAPEAFANKVSPVVHLMFVNYLPEIGNAVRLALCVPEGPQKVITASHKLDDVTCNHCLELIDKLDECTNFEQAMDVMRNTTLYEDAISDPRFTSHFGIGEKIDKDLFIKLIISPTEESFFINMAHFGLIKVPEEMEDIELPADGTMSPPIHGNGDKEVGIISKNKNITIDNE